MMGLSSFFENGRFTVIVAVTSLELLLVLYRRYKSKKILESASQICSNSSLKGDFCKVLFFPDKQVPCFSYLLTAQELAEAILIKYRLGAKVRVIADTEYMNMSGSKMPSFMSEGIAVRHDRSSYLMHHKFVVIDNKVVITGSFNWTHAAVIGNYENVVATNQADIVQPYVVEFDRLWELFDAENGPRREVTQESTLLGKSEKYHIHNRNAKRQKSVKEQAHQKKQVNDEELG